ncbi:MAG: thioredoxin domain-containing protein [Rhodocyclales bacterium]|nr:thioredoxin domain-containing protein [Rhodocyclales bacterium]
MKQKNVFIIAAIGLLVAFIIAALLRNVEREEPPSPIAAARTEAKAPPVATPKSADTGPMMVRPHSPLLGSADAPVMIVEFFDPACETCAAFYPIVKQIRAGNPDNIAVALRYAPFHKGSAKVVAALEAARKQDKYWQALEALLKTQSDWAANHEAHLDRIWPHLKKAGLDVARLQADMADPAIAGVINLDLADAQAFRVSKTPEFFVNGKPLPSFGQDPLKALVASELAAKKAAAEAAAAAAAKAASAAAEAAAKAAAAPAPALPMAPAVAPASPALAPTAAPADKPVTR